VRHELAQRTQRHRREGRQQILKLIIAQRIGCLKPRFPNPAASLEVVQAMAQNGADLIELGVPFSDPLADGPTIQHSTQVALQQGMNVARCLEMTAQLRRSGLSQPLLLMGYINPLLAYGTERFVTEAAEAGADGLILPDLPVEEAQEIEGLCRQHGLALVYLLAPTSPPERIALLAEHASGFLYLVSVTGVTGARQSLPPDLQDFVTRVRAQTDLPLAVGFGIATPQHAAEVGKIADGVIVGSALIRAAGEASDPAKAATNFLRELSQALQVIQE
jgi:tryptophan synthase alpha chain